MSQFESLRADLAELADDVHHVDLRDRSIATSRRIQRRRAVVGSSLAVVIVVAGVAVLTRPSRDQSIGPADPSVTADVSLSPTGDGSATPSPSPTHTVSLPPPRTSPSLGSPSTTGTQSLPGTVYFELFEDVADPSNVRVGIGILSGGQLRTSWFGEVYRGECLLQTLRISPDGARAAWVLGDAGGAGGDELLVSPLSGGTPTVVAREASCSTRPYWLPDSKTLVSYTDRGFGRVDVDTGAFAPFPERYAGYVGWSQGGGYVAYNEGGEIVVESSTGAVKYRVPYDINCCTGGFTVQGVSADGRYVGVNYAPSDPGGVFGTMRVVDMTTGQEVALPVPMSGRLLSHVLFLADGGMLVQTRPEGGGDMTLHLVSAAGQVTQTLPQSGVLNQAFPWLYLP